MHADSSALVPTAPTTEINLVSSPPTSHATSPTRVRSSPLRPSSAANVVVEASSGGRGTGKSAIAAYSVDPVEAYVANSDPEDDDEQIGHSDSAQASQPLSLPSSPVRSGKRAFAANIDQESSSSVYVQIPAASPSSRPPRQTPGSTKKNKKKQQSDTSRSGGSDAFDSAEQDAPTAVEDDDAAYAAALAAQEATLARRRPTRNARKEVSYGPNCDLEGRPLSSKRQKESTTKSKVAAKDSLTAQNARDKRRSRDFSDDDEEAVEGAKPGPSSSSKSKRELGSKHAAEDDEDLTDDDIGFAARDRKKAKTSKLITAISDSEEEAATSRTTRGKKTQPERSSRRDKIKDDARVSDEGESERDNDILTPPAPTSPRRSTRRSVPSPKKKQAKEAAEDKPQKSAGKGKKKQRKTFDLDRDGEEEEEAEEKKDEGETVEDVAAQADEASRSSGQKIAEADGEEAEEEEAVNSAPPAKPSASPTISKASLSTSSPALTSTSTPRSAPTTVAIKRIATSGTSSPTLHASSPTTSASPRSFFGKPLTTLLSTGAARRPGLTRKHNIPSLLNHRGAPKAPVRGLVVSKRRMQDDDYEYDAEYEALIAKGKKGSDDEDASDAEVVEKEEEEDEGLEEYD
ncbi:hypothetical protein PHSY_003986 [Pseudozyma hubeiensis SY62]|uniref:Uncharacterized protein n=1 Tax=Pseudozyma hubeiensis (strain SY62) TaxID=1305764 RepID=R9P4Y0_PSEHS|nr:hypothetical protein PHSY_003986 [Pseudozyma hubeiensis SY62]GAC96406.1 hypothetical protein PHSY_003986 [Pseudozyma hubeiensis SY62]